MKRKGIFFIIILFNINCFAQFYSTGVEPDTVVWKQINTKNYQLIFPQSYSNKALKLANTLEYSYSLVNQTLKKNPRKMPVIIHNYSAISNGMVAWAPNRMELYPNPPQDCNADDWIPLLALHESRHVVQMEMLNTGFTNFLTIPFGQAPIGFISGFIPPWLFEGDAVVTETALSNSGRGRTPSFGMELRAQIVERGSYNLLKAELGSFADYVPDHYQLGYYFVAYNRAKYGAKLWNNQFKNNGQYTPFPFTFNLTLKSNSMNWKRGMYQSTFDELRMIWNNEIAQTTIIEGKTITKNKSSYTKYRFPCVINDSLIVASRVSLDEITSLVTIDNKGNEKKIFNPGFYQSENLSASNNLIVWSEIVSDIRWEQINYSILKKYDFKTGIITNLTKKGRYFSPSISPNGMYIAVVDYSYKNQSSIVILNSENGAIIRRFHNNDYTGIQLPSWDEQSRKIVCTYSTSKGKAIAILDIEGGKWETIIEPSENNVAQPIFYNHYIVYRTGVKHADNICAISLQTKNIFQITSIKFGAFDPVINTNSNTLYFCNYTSYGYGIQSMKLDSTKWLVLQNDSSYDQKLASQISVHELIKFDASQIPKNEYAIKPYHKMGNLFKFHSWAPLYINLNNTLSPNLFIPLGITLFSQNHLNTLLSSVGYTYFNLNHFFFTRFTYSGFYPVIDFEIGNDYEKIINLTPNKLNSNIKDIHPISIYYNTTISLPLQYQFNSFNASIKPYISAINNQYWSIFNYSSASNKVISDERKTITTITPGITAKYTRKKSYRDIYPGLGASLSISTEISNINYFGDNTNVVSHIFLPGIFKNQHLIISPAYQNQKTGKYYSFNTSLVPRGYDSIFSTSSISLFNDYTFPILNNVYNFTKLLYCKRVVGNIFSDFDLSRSNSKSNSINNLLMGKLSSYGFELTFDLQTFYIPIIISPGIRYSYLHNKDKIIPEFIIRNSYSF